MLHNYPLLLDVADREIVIVGGGEVAVRKAVGLLDAGATDVRVIAPRMHERMPQQVKRITESYRAEHLHGASLVFAATDDPSVNDTIVRDSRQLGMLVCRADADEENAGDFATPAMIRRDPVLITVSTGGSPSLAALIRGEIEKSLDSRWTAMAQAMISLRPRIRAIPSLAPSRRKEIFRTLASDDALNVLSAGDPQALVRWIICRYPELAELGSA
jgi:siroheme synthase-like protein